MKVLISILIDRSIKLNICELIESVQVACNSKKIVCKSVQKKLSNLGLQYSQFGTYKKLKFNNTCNLVYIDKEKFIANKRYRSQVYLSTGYYIIVGTASQYEHDPIIHCGWYRKLSEEEAITLTIFQYSFNNVIK